MKEKLLAKIILIILVLSFIFNFLEVKAYSGEIDPEKYITMPSIINMSNGKAKGTVSLSSKATGYNIAYQKVDITESQYNNLTTKSNELKNYIAEVNKNIDEKETEIGELEKIYEDLLETEPDNREAITEAQNNYQTAFNDYNEYYDKESEKIENMKKDYYADIPNFTDSWIETTNTSNNIQFDFSSYTGGKIFFILWVKISNGSNTYYNFNGYSTEIINPINEKEPSAGSEDKTDTQTGEWTDFSKAKFELVKDGVSNAIVEISNVTYNKESTYYLLITNNSQKPNITGNIENYNNKINLEYNKDTNKFVTTGDEVRRNVELNQDLYATVVESNSEGKQNIISYGKKLDRFEESKYSDAFYETFVSSDTDQIVTNFTHAQVNNRKIQIKIGKITDNSILQKIKNKDASGFSSLLNYAKSNNAIYNETTDAVKDDWYAIEYKTDQTVGSTKSKLINLTSLQNNEYYYLYVKTDDENGKYISNEAVTLAQANVYDGRWSMYFYGSEDFKWADFGNIKDDTVANVKIPQTGTNTFGLALCGTIIISIGLFSYISYKKNKF